MLLKHLQASPPQTSLPVPDSAVTDRSCGVKRLNSFPAGTTPGPSGLKVYHLKEALSCPSPWVNSLYLKPLCSFVNVLCSGDILADVVPHLYSDSLNTLKKKSGGLCPVAVGEINTILDDNK